MGFIKLKNIEHQPVMVNTDSIRYFFESKFYHPLTQENYNVTKIIFGDESHLNVLHSLDEVKHLIESV